MTKIIRIDNINFGSTTINIPIEKNLVVYNDGTENITVNAVTTDNAIFTPETFTSQKMNPRFPANSTIYFDSNGFVQDTNSEFYTTNQNFGSLGVTDSNGVLTIDLQVESVEITAPLPSFYYEENSSITISGNTIALSAVNLDYSTDGGGNWNNIITGLGCLGGTFSHIWTAPSLFENESVIIRASGITQSDTVTGTLWVDSWIPPYLTIKGYLGTATATAEFVTVYKPEDNGIIGTATAAAQLITVYNPEDSGIIGTATAIAELI